MTTKLQQKPSRRIEKQEATKRKLFEAAAQQIGREGYAGASIQRITTAAEIANGTFYNYFSSQQDLFDQLLPEMGRYLLTKIRQAIKGETNSIKREELGFRAFFDYLSQNPSFYRVLNESETYAPKAYADHMNNMADGYLRALRTAKEKGELHDFSDRELEVIVYILLSSRNYLAYHFTFQNGKSGRLPDWIASAYMKFILGGIGNSNRTFSTPPERAKKAPEQRYAVSSMPTGYSSVSIAIDDDRLSDSGSVEKGHIAALIERSGAEAVGREGKPSFEMTSVAVNFIRSTHARKLVAEGTRTAISEQLAHVTVYVYEDDDKSKVIATGLAVYTFEMR